ncbi:MAG: metallophosphoesterase, partial [Gemmatimonadales bacterium]
AFLVTLGGGRPLSAQPSPEDQEAWRLEGEYGLYVGEAGDTIDVRWFTADEDSGFLEVRRGEATVGSSHATDDSNLELSFTTVPGHVHAATFARPADGPLTITYGALGSEEDRHHTTIWPPPRRSEVRFGPVDSLFVVGDVHGEFDTLTAVLRNAGLIDRNGNWRGGRRHLVLLGDLFDRGDDVTRTLWFLYGLERQAEAAGGNVHVVLGNHEIMVLVNDLRYTSEKELSIGESYGIPYAGLFDIRRSVLGRWLASKPGLIRIGRVLLAHGGVARAYADYSLRAFDDSLAAFMSEELFRRWGQPPDSTLPPIVMDSLAADRRIDFFFGENSVFWYRGYVMADTLQAALREVLARHDSDVHVVGHTALDEIEIRYDGALLAVDLNSAAGQLLLLVMEDDGLRALRYGSEGPPEPLDSGPEGSSEPLDPG